MSGIARTEEAIVQSPPSTRGATRLGNAITPYWGEVIVVAIALIVWLPRLSGPIDLRWDAGVYYVLGSSLASGHGYRILSEPGAPEALQYPPLLPAFVALHQRILGTTNPAVIAPWVRISYATLYLIYGLTALALARCYLRPVFALIAVALALLQVNTLFISDLLFAELPFAVVAVLFALIATSDSHVSWAREALSFLFASASFLLRTAGAALLVAWVVEALVRRRWSLALLRCVLVLLPVLAWQAHVMRVRGSYEYAHPAYEYQRASYQFYNVSYADNVAPMGSLSGSSTPGHNRAFAMRLAANFCRMGKRLGEAISASEGYWRELFAAIQHQVFGRNLLPPTLAIVPIVSLSALVFAGIGLLLYRRVWLMALIIITSIALICATPWPDQFQRYLMPLTIFLAITAMLTLSNIQALLARDNTPRTIKLIGHVAVVGVLVVLLALQIYAAADIFGARKRAGASLILGLGNPKAQFFYYDRLWRNWEQAIVWLGEHSGPNAVTATPYSHLCYLLTGRPAVSPPAETDVTRVRHLLESVPVSFVIVDRGYKLPAIENNSPGWTLVQSFDDTRLYQNIASAKE